MSVRIEIQKGKKKEGEKQRAETSRLWPHFIKVNMLLWENVYRRTSVRELWVGAPCSKRSTYFFAVRIIVYFVTNSRNGWPLRGMFFFFFLDSWRKTVAQKRRLAARPRKQQQQKKQKTKNVMSVSIGKEKSVQL